MSDIADERLVAILDGDPEYQDDIQRMAEEIRRRREAHAAMLLEVDALAAFASSRRAQSELPRTVEAVNRILDTIRKAGG